MKKNTCCDLFEDDFWDDVPSPSRKASSPSGKHNREDSDWDNLFDEPAPNRKNHSRSRKAVLPVRMLSALAVVFGAVLLLTVLLPGIGNAHPVTEPQQTTEAIIFQTEPVPTVPAPEATTPAEPRKDYRYFGAQLTDTQQRRYDAIANGIACCDSEISGIRVADWEELDLIVTAVIRDHAEFFWFTGGYSCSYTDSGDYLEVTLVPDYRWDYQTCMDNKQYVEEAVRDIIVSLQNRTDYEKVKGVYDYLVDYTIYDRAYTGKTIYELFSEKHAVCDAYARSAQYLLNQLDVEVIYVVGDSDGAQGREGHAWNIVNVEGDYYQLDVTWGDPLSMDGIQTKSYDFLCVTDAEIGRSHYPDWSLYPSCTANTYNYHVYEGNYLRSYDLQILTDWIAHANDTGRRLELKAADQTIYNTVKRNLLENGEIQSLFEQAIGCSTGYSWSWNDDMYTIIITW